LAVSERSDPAPVSCGRMFVEEAPPPPVITPTDGVFQQSTTNVLGLKRSCRTPLMQQWPTSTSPTNKNVSKSDSDHVWETH
jgi:hypothetical protein